ncbi:MAG: YchF-related putative GTPase [Candidatus Micrarchaeaceae archaeon]
MFIGIIGAPNKGKSTFFSAITSLDISIADYPFTTIKPNVGTTYFVKPCPEKELNLKCKPRNSLCINGNRRIPIKIVDVAGLVPDANSGKGMGNQFLNDLSGADALILVVDISGETDELGNPTKNHNAISDIQFIQNELITWLSNIIKSHITSISKLQDGVSALKSILSSFKANEIQIKKAADEANVVLSYITWGDVSIKKFSECFIKLNKPMVVVANKLDKSNNEKVKELADKLKNIKVIGCSAAIELALIKAANSGAVSYSPGDSTFIVNTKDEEKLKALEYIKKYLEKNNDTGIQKTINYVVESLLEQIVVYPVENENKYTDHFGNVLPDAILIKKGSTAIELASKIHTDLAEKMIYALDARSKNRLSKEYILKDNDIIKIVSAAK